MIADFIKLYDRDIAQLENEIALFNHDENLWKVTGSVINTSGNLCLHLCGNLNAFIGNNLGHTGYVRDRAFEFVGKNVPKEDLLTLSRNTRHTINRSLSKLTDDDLKEKYPVDFLGYEMTTGYGLAHLLAHFSFHLGQINYLRRILEQ